MPVDMQKARELFLHAVGKLPPEKWSAYLAEACGGDTDLQRQVEGLLQVHREAGSFLDAPAVQPVDVLSATASQSIAELPGTQIGPYKLLQQIGEGGMGTVFMAEQTEPVRRRVALKIIKPGMDSRHVIARFTAEKQALALMDHANIARVLDAGITERGRPYFVMELVHGVPITQYCDDKHLTPRQRLELLLPVCQAIQHAHQKGIIHRDIKPMNILVAEYDHKAIPKVIDFGVAKAVGSPLTEKTMFTGVGQIVGTLEYMSPEQAKVNQLDVDTRSDIYSLGVLLYELLTGSTPFDKRRLRSAAFDEMLRIIREEEPQKPSTRLSSVGSADNRSAQAVVASAEGPNSTLASIAALRSTEPARLTKLVRGELDWIVMKALEKDRNARYETANDFARDLERYLHDEPVQVCPPSVAYRFRKFARRYRGTLAIACVATVAVLLALIGLTISNVLITREKDRTAAALKELGDEKEAYKSQLQRANENLRLVIHKGGATVWDNWEKGYLLHYQDLTFHQYLLPEEADALRRSLQVYLELTTVNRDGQSAPLEVASAGERLAWLQLALGEYVGAEQTLRPTVALLEDLAGKNPTVTEHSWRLVDDYGNLAMALEKVGRYSDAEQAYRQSLRVDADIVDHRDRYPFASDDSVNQRLGWGRIFFGRLLLRTGRPSEAEEAFRQGLTFGDSPFLHSNATDGLARVFQSTDRLREAEDAYRGVCRLWEKLHAASPGNRHYRWKIAVASKQLGEFYQATCRDKEAGTEYGKALKIWEDLTAEYPTVPAYPRQLAWFLACSPFLELPGSDRATTLAGKATELAPTDGHNWATLALARYRTGNWSQAQAAVEKAMNLRPWGEGLDWFLLAMIRRRLDDELGARQWYEKAVKWTEKNDTYNPELRRLQAEAAELMGLSAPPTSTPALSAGLIMTAEQPSVQYLLDSARPFAETRNWKQAAAELGSVGEGQRSDLFFCYSTALARLLAGDIDAYARLAAEMPARESATRDRSARLNVLRTCTVHSRGAPDPALLVPLAQSAYDEEASNWSAQNLGMAHFRAGNFDKALRSFEEARKLADWYLYWPAYAMCHQQLGHADEARQWLDKSDDFFRQVTETGREPLEVTKEPFWQDWAYFEVMLLEARNVVGAEINATK